MTSKILFLASLFSLFGLNWDAIDRRIDEEYPGITFISADFLLTAAGDVTGQPMIVDVREPEEFAISRLEQAINLQTGAAIAERFPDRDTPIVVYCSIGYRAAAVASQLEALGYTNVKNLRHAIFEWANRGLPMVNADGHTDKVHPFNRIWGSLVERSLRQYP